MVVGLVSYSTMQVVPPGLGDIKNSPLSFKGEPGNDFTCNLCEKNLKTFFQPIDYL